MAFKSVSLLLMMIMTLTPVLLFLNIPQASAQTAPAPSPPGPINITGLLDKNGQFTIFIRLLTETQVARQLETQLNNSNQGLTMFAPTDNAFNSLPSGTVNNLSPQNKVQLVLHHVTPSYYTLSDLLTVSNPVRTLATGQDGQQFGLNFTGQNNQVNVTAGVVTTQINNALRQQMPLAIYQVDKVLLPVELSGAETPKTAPQPGEKPSHGGASNSTKSGAPSPSADKGDAAGKSIRLGFVVGLALMCIGSIVS